MYPNDNKDDVEILRKQATSLVRAFSCYAIESSPQKTYKNPPFGWRSGLKYWDICNEKPNQDDLITFLRELKRVISEYSVLFLNDDLSNISDIRIAEPFIDEHLYTKDTINLEVVECGENDVTDCPVVENGAHENGNAYPLI